MAVTTARTISKAKARERLESVRTWELEALKAAERELDNALKAVRKAKSNILARRRVDKYRESKKQTS